MSKLGCSYSVEGSVFHAGLCSFIDHRTSEAELASWLHSLGICTGPHTHKGSVPGLMLCCCCLNILNPSGQKNPAFSFVTGS